MTQRALHSGRRQKWDLGNMNKLRAAGSQNLRKKQNKTKHLTCPVLSEASYSIVSWKKLIIKKTFPHKERTEETFQLLAKSIRFCPKNKTKLSL